MADLARIKRNVAKMVAQNAPETDIDGYIASEGVTVEDVRNFDEFSQKTDLRQGLKPPANKEQLMQGLRKDVWDNRLGAVTKFDQGASFGLGKKLGGIANAVFSAPIDWWAGALGYETPSRLDRYNEIVKPAVEAGKRFEEQHPVGSVALEIAGNFANPANYLGAGLVANTAKFLPKLGKAGVLGAATGAADALGRYNSVDDVLGNIGTDAALGSAVNLAFPVAGKTLGLLGKGARGLDGWLTGTGGALNAAYDAGKRKSSVFLQNMRNIAPKSDAVDYAKEALTKLKLAKNEKYRLGMAELGKDAQKVDISPIRNDFEAMKKSYDYKGFSRADKTTKKAMDEIENILTEFEQNPAAHDVVGLDAVKQAVQDISFPYEQRAANSFVGRVANNLKSNIEKQNPGYAKTMRDYALASEEIDELSKNLLGGGKKINTTTALGKMQRAFRNNAQSAYGRGEDLVGKLGTKATDALAGQALNSLLPRGLIGNIGGLTAGWGALTNPATLAAAPFLSPRLMGEVAYWTGRGAPILGNLAKGLNPAGLSMPLSAAFSSDNY